MEDILQRERVLRPQRKHDRIVGRSRLQFEIERAAEPLAQSQPPRAIHADAEWRMHDQLHAAGFIEEAFQHEPLLRGDHAKGAVSRGEIVRQLPRAGGGQSGFFLEAIGNGIFERSSRFGAGFLRICSSTSNRNRETAADSSSVRAGASPSQNGIPGG